MKTLYNILLTLVIIGAINWGILGLFKVDLIGSMFGGMTSAISRIIFTLVEITFIIPLQNVNSCISCIRTEKEPTLKDDKYKPYHLVGNTSISSFLSGI